MGFSEKAQVEGGIDSDSNRKWVIAGIALRAPLKPIYTIPVVEKEQKEEVETEECSSTPTSEESRIPTTFTCPPAPKKRKTSLKCNYRRVVREFFTPPDLETVFIRQIEKAN
ncbi:cyclin-dependent protein kinase inhibitor SMR6-like [Sesbania bispinosa]|nr:cyclin-dependent protein kinase inhibitor SMR6-like [Sesbania bispinosa]